LSVGYLSPIPPARDLASMNPLIDGLVLLRMMFSSLQQPEFVASGFRIRIRRSHGRRRQHASRFTVPAGSPNTLAATSLQSFGSSCAKVNRSPTRLAAKAAPPTKPLPPHTRRRAAVSDYPAVLASCNRLRLPRDHDSPRLPQESANRYFQCSHSSSSAKPVYSLWDSPSLRPVVGTTLYGHRPNRVIPAISELNLRWLEFRADGSSVCAMRQSSSQRSRDHFKDGFRCPASRREILSADHTDWRCAPFLQLVSGAPNRPDRVRRKPLT